MSELDIAAKAIDGFIRKNKALTARVAELDEDLERKEKNLAVTYALLDGAHVIQQEHEAQIASLKALEQTHKRHPIRPRS